MRGLGVGPRVGASPYKTLLSIPPPRDWRTDIYQSTLLIIMINGSKISVHRFIATTPFRMVRQ